MESSRDEIYSRLHKCIGNTPLVELPLNLPNGNRILLKEEFRNPTGSHYDRVYVNLIEALEREGTIEPGITPLIETTSGSAGESFAWLCNELGYDATIILPENAPPKKIDIMRAYGAELVFTSAHDYVTGAASTLRKFLTEINRERKKKGKQAYYCPNHSRDERTLESLEGIAKETLEQSGTDIDYFVAAVGNGSSLLGPGRYFAKHSPKTRIIGWEPIESGKATELMFPGDYQFRFGIRPGRLRHVLFGTGTDIDIRFPFLEQALEGEKKDRILKNVMLVSSSDSEDKVRAMVDPENRIPLGSDGETMRRVHWILNARACPSWETIAETFRDIGYEGGRTTAAGVAIALDMMKDEKLRFTKKFPFLKFQKIEGKTFFTIGYDLMSKYC